MANKWAEFKKISNSDERVVIDDAMRLNFSVAIKCVTRDLIEEWVEDEVRFSIGIPVHQVAYV